MFQQQLPITGCVRPRNRWANQWERKRLKKLRLTRGGIFWGQKNKRWILQALERRTGRTMAWVVCGQSWCGTAGKLYHKLSPLKEGVFDTDDWKGYSKVWPTEQHGIGEKTQFAWNNSRHYLGKMAGRSKIGSRSEEMISLSKARWQALIQAEIFQDHQTKLYL